jgi:hypothetical protein
VITKKKPAPIKKSHAPAPKPKVKTSIRSASTATGRPQLVKKPVAPSGATLPDPARVRLEQRKGPMLADSAIEKSAPAPADDLHLPTREGDITDVPLEFRDILETMVRDRDEAKIEADAWDVKRKGFDDDISGLLIDLNFKKITIGDRMAFIVKGTNVQIDEKLLVSLGVSADLIAAAKVRKSYSYVQVKDAGSKDKD